MLNIEIKEFGVENFGPFKSKTNLKFDNGKLILISGANGVGKTSLIGSLAYTLYGKMYKNMKQDKVINNEVKKDCRTWVTFETYEEDEPEKIDFYKIVRFRKYKNIGNSVHLYKNDLNQPIAKGQVDVLPYIERIFSTYSVFNNSIMFGQKIKDFFTNLIDSEKRKIFESILNYQLYEILYQHVNKKLNNSENTFVDLKNDLLRTETRLETAQERLLEIKKEKIEFYLEKKNQIQDILKQIQFSENLIFQIQNKVDEFEKLEELEKQKKELQAKLDQIEYELNNLNKDKIESDLKSLQTKYKEKNNTEKENKLAQETQQREKINNIIQIERIKFEESSKKISKFNFELNQRKEKIIQEKIKLQTDIKYNEKQISEMIKNQEAEVSQCTFCFYEKQNEDLKSKLQILQNNLDDIEKESQEAAEENQHEEKMLTEFIKLQEKNLNIYINKKQEKYDFFYSELSKEYEEKKAEIIKKYNIIKNKLKEKEKEIQPILIKFQKQINQIQDLNNQILNQKIELKNLIKQKQSKIKKKCDNSKITIQEKTISDLKKTKKKIKNIIKDNREYNKILLFWKNGFSPKGIPSMLIDEAIPFLNSKSQEYLDLISNGRYILSFDTLEEDNKGSFKDKISVHVFDNITRADDISQFSGGQVRLVDIATLFAISDLSDKYKNRKINLMLFDEVFDSLDEENILNVVKSIQKIIQKDNKNILLCNHTVYDQIDCDVSLTL
jgi:DNA repair exonuclease SbcCD ATPase subunit